jgi:hypothetical protein
MEKTQHPTIIDYQVLTINIYILLVAALHYYHIFSISILFINVH